MYIWENYYNFRVVIVGFVSSASPKNEIEGCITLDSTLHHNIFPIPIFPSTSLRCSSVAFVASEEICSWEVQHDFNILSVTLNPVIYTITDRRFRMFIKRRLMRLKREVKAVYINWIVIG